MSWIINTIVVSTLIIMIAHCVYEYFKDGVAGEQTLDLADLKTRQYKAIIEKMTKDAKVVEDMDTELTEYMKSKIEE
jgi:Trk K+ transport system NAD-binding subunit